MEHMTNVSTGEPPMPDGARQLGSFLAGGVGFCRVYVHRGHVVITGTPSELVHADDESHNCDAMGCGQEHVIFREKVSE